MLVVDDHPALREGLEGLLRQEDIPAVLAKANQALATLDKYRSRLDQVSTRLTALEFEGGVLGLALNLDEDSIGAVVLRMFAFSIRLSQNTDSSASSDTIPILDVNSACERARREAWHHPLEPEGEPERAAV